MISGLLASLGIGWWLPIALFPFLGAGLVAIYRNKPKGERRLVPTLFLLREFATISSSPSAIRLPLRFFLELLILLTLCCAAANLAFSPDGKVVAVILDSSLSMNARKSVSQAGSLFDDAKQRALEHLKDLNSQSRVTLFTSAPVLKQRGGQGVSPSEARALLPRIEVTSFGDSLSDSIGELSRRGSFDRILVFTDRQPELTNIASGAVVQKGFRPEIMTVRAPQGSSRSNVALGEVEPLHSEKEVGLLVPIISFAEHRGSGKVSLHTLNRDLTWQVDPLVTRNVKLEPGKLTKMLLNFSLTPNQAYRITWSSDAAGSGAQDMLSDDSVAYFVYTPEAYDWKIVSRFSERELNVGGLFKGSAKVYSPEDFERLPLSEQESGKTIFHGVAPRNVQGSSVLIVNPPVGSSLLKGVTAASKLPVRWETGHQLLTYISAGGLRFPDARVLVESPEMEVLIALQEGPVMMSREAASSRAVVVGFELFPYEGASAITKSTLLLNALKWLNAAPGNRSSASGVNYSIGQSFDGGVASQPEAINRWFYIGGGSRGVAGKLAKPGIVSNGEDFRSVSVSNPLESNLSAQAALPRSYPSHGKQRTKESRSLSWLLGLVALGLLLVDAALQLQSRSSLVRGAGAAQQKVAQ